MTAPRPLILCSACGCEADPSWTHRGRVLCERCVAETPEAFVARPIGPGPGYGFRGYGEQMRREELAISGERAAA